MVGDYSEIIQGLGIANQKLAHKQTFDDTVVFILPVQKNLLPFQRFFKEAQIA